jgi:hypothetical protein
MIFPLDFGTVPTVWYIFLISFYFVEFSVFFIFLGMMHSWSEFISDVICYRFKLGKYQQNDSTASSSSPISRREQENNPPIKSHVGIRPVLTCKHDGGGCSLLQILLKIVLKLDIGKDYDKKE